MSRTSILILLGILIIIVPFTGFPMNIRSLLEVVLGACVLGIGFSIRAGEVKPVSHPQEPSSIA